MTKSQLVAKVARETSLSQREAGRLLETVLAEVAAALQAEGRVSLRGFGTFQVRERAERVNRHPRTGEKLLTPRHLVVAFRPAEALLHFLGRENPQRPQRE